MFPQGGHYARRRREESSSSNENGENEFQREAEMEHGDKEGEESIVQEVGKTILTSIEGVTIIWKDIILQNIVKN